MQRERRSRRRIPIALRCALHDVGCLKHAACFTRRATRSTERRRIPVDARLPGGAVSAEQRLNLAHLERRRAVRAAQRIADAPLVHEQPDVVSDAPTAEAVAAREQCASAARRLLLEADRASFGRQDLLSAAQVARDATQRH